MMAPQRLSESLSKASGQNAVGVGSHDKDCADVRPHGILNRRIMPGHEYTQSNAKFAMGLEPSNTALQERSREIDKLRSEASPRLLIFGIAFL